MIFGNIITIHIPIEFKAADGNSLQWPHNGRNGVSNHQPHDCLLNRLFRRRPKKTSKLCVTDLCAGNSLVTGEFPAQMASNAENVSIWWRHHVSMMMFCITLTAIAGVVIPRCARSLCVCFSIKQRIIVHIRKWNCEQRVIIYLLCISFHAVYSKEPFADVIGFILFCF